MAEQILPSEQQSLTPIGISDQAAIVCAYVHAAGGVPLEQMPQVINTIYGATFAFFGIPLPTKASEEPAAPQEPAVSIKKSITQDYLICLDDGLKFKSLKRHLAVLGMSPEEYRRKWGLPADYPMVAPGYAAQRSALAKSMGLGTRGRGLPPKKSPARKR